MSECTCTKCTALRKLGYKDAHEWAKRYLDPITDTMKVSVQMAIKETQTAHELSAEDVKQVIYEMFTGHLLGMSSTVTYITNGSARDFLERAMEAATATWGGARPSLVQLSLEEARALLSALQEQEKRKEEIN